MNGKIDGLYGGIIKKLSLLKDRLYSVELLISKNQ